MNNFRTNFLLAVLLLAVAGLDFFLYFSKGSTPTSGSRLLVDAAADLRCVRLTRAESQEVVLECDSGGWRLTRPFAGSADQQAVLRLIDILQQAPILDSLSDSDLLELGRTRTDFSLEDPLVSIELTDGSNARTSCSFGSLTPTADGVYASVEGVPVVYVVPTNILAAVNVSPDVFRRRSLFPPDTGSVTSFSFRREGVSPVEFVRSDSGWSVNGKTVAPSVPDYLIRLTAVEAVSFIWPVGASNEPDHASASLLAGYGLDPDSAVSVTLTTADGKGRRIAFGKSVGEGLVYALAQNGGAIVTVPVALRDFVQQDPVLFVDSRIFPGEARSVTAFSIGADGGLYSLSRGPDALWRLESPVVAAADQDAVETILSRILALSPSDVVAKGGISVSVGTNSTKVVVARDRVLGTSSFEQLRSREMLKVDPSLAKRIVSSPKGKDPIAVVFDRDLRQWNLEKDVNGAKVSAKGVESVLTMLNPLVATRVEKLNVAASDLDDYGLDAPFLTVAIDQNADGAVRRNVLVGKKAKGGRFATIGSSDAIFVVSDKTVEGLSSSLVTP